MEKRLKWLKRVTNDQCARPEVSLKHPQHPHQLPDLIPQSCMISQVTCRHVYSMGVRQAVWRQRLWAEPDMRIVSAGIPDYDTAVPNARFCLHTEGNGWGARVVDYMAMECLPLMINDGMIFPYSVRAAHSKSLVASGFSWPSPAASHLRFSRLHRTSSTGAVSRCTFARGRCLSSQVSCATYLMRSNWRCMSCSAGTSARSCGGAPTG